MVVSQSEAALRPYHVTFMADTKQPVSISLRLDNGDCIRASVGDRDRSARYVSITQRIELGQLSAEEQSKQLDEIAHIYQRLSDCAGAQTIGPPTGHASATKARPVDICGRSYLWLAGNLYPSVCTPVVQSSSIVSDNGFCLAHSS